MSEWAATDAGALANILDECRGGPWKPDDGTSLWFYNEAGDQICLTPDDVLLLLHAALAGRSSDPEPAPEPGDVTIGEMQERLARAMGCPLDADYPDCSHGGDAWEYARHLIRDGFAIVPLGAVPALQATRCPVCDRDGFHEEGCRYVKPEHRALQATGEPRPCLRCGIAVRADEERKCSASNFSLWCSDGAGATGEGDQG